MNILDWVIIGWLAIAFFTGARLGLVYRVGHIVGLGLGVYLAVEYYDVVAGWVGDSITANITAFIVLFVGVAELAGIAAVLLDKFFHILSWVPFLKTANVILGGLLSALTHCAIISVIIFFSTTQVINTVFVQTINESTLGPIAAEIGSTIAVFIPFI
ncbi:MAG: hypothetical protein ACD_43C00156G0003 [uncultured bacterium]|nr:MAG: hypothetical protein ACD_43C00156G0003 [uncultured bacterium]